MAYNKAKAELEWHQWKEAEEQKLRQLGATEETIKRLHDYDWSIFKSDRRFYEREFCEETYEPQQEDNTPYSLKPQISSWTASTTRHYILF